LKLLTTFLALLPLLATAAPSPPLPIEQCAQHLPFGQPKSARSNTTLICRPGYALEHDNVGKTALWVAYVLTPERAVGCASRDTGFVPDPALKRGGRAELKDYSKSGHEIGHLASSADFRWSAQASIDVNVLSNAAPQLRGLNRGAWKALENRTRSWAVGRSSPLLIYVGTISPTKGATTIGRNQVAVPTAFWKVLVDTQTKEVVAFIYPHQASQAPPEAFRTSLYEVQRRAGYTLPVPSGATLAEQVWPLTASAASLKARTCSIR